MEKIVLTGGPSGGKSTAIRHLETYHPEIATGPEVATMLLSGGFPAPTEEHPWSYRWQRGLQLAIGSTQLALEQILDERADCEYRPAIVYDRGLADGASYLRDGLDELGQLINLPAQDIVGRYGLVIHLVTSAKQSRGYKKDTNPNRFEEAEEAIRLDDRVQEVWASHPNRIVLDIEDTMARNNAVSEHILDFSS
jgi:predicted ATPase